jgi:hypothetical protein
MLQGQALIEWANLQLIVLPELQLLFHIPNEGRRTPFEAGVQKSVGLKKGVWDYLLPVPRHFRGTFCAGLWIELKSPGKELTSEQDWWGRKMDEQGYLMHVAHSWVSAKEVICEYLSGDATAISKCRH